MALKKYVADKTNWRTMLKNDVSRIDLIAAKKTVLSQAHRDLAPIFEKYRNAITLMDDARVFEFHYPVMRYPEKVTALSFDKTPKITGILQGIKGQYLIFDCGVLNIRKFGGYRVEIASQLNRARSEAK